MKKILLSIILLSGLICNTSHAVDVDLTSGTTGTLHLDRTFNETRAAGITVLSPYNLAVSSMTLNEFNLDFDGNVGARIYQENGQLIALANTTVSAGNNLTVTIPISTTLISGESYRIGFFISSGSNGGSGDMWESAKPYTESTGLFKITGAFFTQLDDFPTRSNIYIPTMMGVEVSITPCNIQLKQRYNDGDTVTADVFRIANLTTNSIATELKLWLSLPGVPPISVTNVGADGGFVLPAGTDIDLGPAPLFTVTAALPRGAYEFSCRMLDPVTGELLTEDRNTFAISNYGIGQTGPAGGIVFFITPDGLHGLEAAPIDQVVPFAPGAEWGCAGTEITGADGTAIGTGAQNTADIIAGCTTPGIAARIADAYTLNGFDDWFLPSKDEFIELYLNRDVVGGFSNNYYWISTEFDSNVAWILPFQFGTPSPISKNGPLGVRAVRAF